MAEDFDDHQAALRTYLGDGASRYAQSPTDFLQQPFDAEVAAQASRLSIPDPFPADLAEALYRRVAVNLAKRAVPQGVVGVGESQLAMRLAMNDPEISRLEAPYRDVFVG